MAASGTTGASEENDLPEEEQEMSVSSLWKGENDSDVEQMETYDSNPLR